MKQPGKTNNNNPPGRPGTPTFALEKQADKNRKNYPRNYPRNYPGTTQKITPETTLKSNFNPIKKHQNRPQITQLNPQNEEKKLRKAAIIPPPFEEATAFCYIRNMFIYSILNEKQHLEGKVKAREENLFFKQNKKHTLKNTPRKKHKKTLPQKTTYPKAYTPTNNLHINIQIPIFDK